MAFIDYYKILGVSKDIPQSDVKKAYLKRTKQFHPDLHPDDPKAKAKFQALTEAYEVIGDPDKRAKYDRYGEHWREADAYRAAGGGFNGGGGSFDGFDFGSFGNASGGGFSSFFENLFGGSRHGSRGAQSTGNIESAVDIDLYTALLGGEVIIQLGNGGKVKLKVKPCTQNGTKVRLRGKGRSMGNGTNGDLIITYNVKLPDNLTDRQKTLLMQMRDGQ